MTLHRAAFHQAIISIVDKDGQCGVRDTTMKMALLQTSWVMAFCSTKRTLTDFPLSLIKNGYPMRTIRTGKTARALPCRPTLWWKDNKPYLSLLAAGGSSYSLATWRENGWSLIWMGRMDIPRSQSHCQIDSIGFGTFRPFENKAPDTESLEKNHSWDGIHVSIRDLNFRRPRIWDSGKWVIRWRGDPSSRRLRFLGNNNDYVKKNRFSTHNKE